MKAKRDTLFSIRNKQLRKERPYSLLILRIWFILECISYLVVFIAASYFVIFFSPNFVWSSSSGTSSANLIGALQLGLFFMAISLPASLFYFVALYKWRMQLWIYDLLAIPLALGGIECFLARAYVDSRFFFLSFFFLIIPIMAAWRVRSFLRRQPDKEEKTTGINISTLREFFIEDILKTKKNTLFSIKSQELRKKCRFSLLLMRLFFIVLCLILIANFSIGFWSLAFHLEAEVSFGDFPSFLLQLELLLLWHLITLRVWSYNFLGFSFPFSLFSLVVSVTDGELSFLYVLVFLAPLVLIAAAWRVHIVSRKISDTQSSNSEDDAGIEPEYII